MIPYAAAIIAAAAILSYEWLLRMLDIHYAIARAILMLILRYAMMAARY